MLLLAVILALGLGLVGVAVVSAVAFVLLEDGRVAAAGRGSLTPRRALLDPNEAARAVGSWG